MENFPNFETPENDPPKSLPKRPPIENPYFFEGSEGSKIESAVEKRSLKKVAKERLEDEDDKSYKERMDKAFNFTFNRHLDEATKSLAKFLGDKKNKQQNPEDLLPVVDIQNRMLSVVAGLSEEDREGYFVKAKKMLTEWTEQAQIANKEDIRNIQEMFDGCMAVCQYMDARKKEYGEAVEFYTDVFLDWKYAIDLVEFHRIGRDEVELRLVQNKSSSYEFDANVDNTIFRHSKWLQYELFGMNDVVDHFTSVLEAEAGSEHQENLKAVGVQVFDSASKYLDFMQAQREGRGSSFDEFFSGESELSKMAFALSFYDEDNPNREGLKERYAKEVVDANREDIITGLDISRVTSIYAVDQEIKNELFLYNERRGGRRLFVGTEPDV